MTTAAQLLRVLALALAPLALALPVPAAAHDRAELEQMLAPIALYPDSVLSHVLIAATYPDEVEEAARWSRRNPKLHGADAVDAVESRDWDPSVKALVAFPEILARMDEDPDWTYDLGEAFLEHEAEVMDSVQVLRDHAYDAGHLRTTEHVRVIRERQYIYIEPAVHHVVYVPYYDPWYVYGSWWWPSHPPYRWRHWHGHAVSYYGTGFYWGLGFRITPTFYFTSFYWPERYVVVTHYRQPDYRPLYSGRHVTRHQGVRHWRGERPARPDTRQPRPPAASGRPDDARGRGQDQRRSRDDDRTDRGDHDRGSRARRSDRDERRDEPERPVRRDDRGSRGEEQHSRHREVQSRLQERETRRQEPEPRGRPQGREARRQEREPPGQSRREDRVRTDPVSPGREADRPERAPRPDDAPSPSGGRERTQEPRDDGRADNRSRGNGGNDERGSRGRGSDGAEDRGNRRERKDSKERSQRDR